MKASSPCLIDEKGHPTGPRLLPGHIIGTTELFCSIAVEILLHVGTLQRSQEKLKHTEPSVDDQQGNALPAGELPPYQGREGQESHNEHHQGHIHHQGGVMARNGFFRGDGEGRQRYRQPTDQHQVEEVGSDNIAQRQGPVTLRQGGDGGDQFGKARSQRHKGKGDDRLGDPQSLGDEGAVLHQKVGSEGDEDRASRQS